MIIQSCFILINIFTVFVSYRSIIILRQCSVRVSPTEYKLRRWLYVKMRYFCYIIADLELSNFEFTFDLCAGGQTRSILCNEDIMTPTNRIQVGDHVVFPLTEHQKLSAVRLPRRALSVTYRVHFVLLHFSKSVLNDKQINIWIENTWKSVRMRSNYRWKSSISPSVCITARILKYMALREIIIWARSLVRKC